ncbi:ribosomal protein L7/L12 [Aquibacillus sp. 3ASR75-11]|uniref:Ribosomal protein L7/L12 n=1 Tax=Terrihalobacillus insolitus TaxID=2950438 RepID=A0A9X3WTG9_9BACI|nr:ribosomal protein L7/L12 [Terrihalobacillus insolitus]MDC3413505.1 ribosomal protein L7/L12 [Terrihalobacillus insolitus]MDC3425205.1 ribosomal protein L7/L12 [Terrihalobacillus insolitus]
MDFIYVLVLIIFVLVVITFFLNVINRLNFIENRIKSMKYTLDRIAKQVNVPEHPLNGELRDLIKDGKKVKAVKRTREILGLSLVEAKKYVDDLDKSKA